MRSTSATSPSGFAAITALFIVAVLAGLGAVLMTVFTAQVRSSAFDVLGTYAYQAARAGIEYGAYQALKNSTCASTALTMSGTLAPFKVQVDCVSGGSQNEAGTTVDTYRITATACNRAACPGTADATYVERQLRITVGTNP